MNITPGEWKVSTYKPTSVWSGDVEVACGLWKPDAQLVAAAPDLFVAVDNWIKLHDHDRILDAYYTSAVIAQMRAALSKAKGEA